MLRSPWPIPPFTTSISAASTTFACLSTTAVGFLKPHGDTSTRWDRYLLHLLCADRSVQVRLQVRDVGGVVRGGGGASGFAPLQLSGCRRRVVQAVVVQHGDHLLFDHLLGQLQVRQRVHGGGAEDGLVDLRGPDRKC